LGELEALAEERERLQEELGDALERLSALGSAADERDRLRTGSSSSSRPSPTFTRALRPSCGRSSRNETP
jgi:hypothetical protein